MNYSAFSKRLEHVNLNDLTQNFQTHAAISLAYSIEELYNGLVTIILM